MREFRSAANLTLGGKQFENGRELLSCMSCGDSFSFPDRVCLLALLDAAILKAFGYPAIKNRSSFLFASNRHSHYNSPSHALFSFRQLKRAGDESAELLDGQRLFHQTLLLLHVYCVTSSSRTR